MVGMVDSRTHTPDRAELRAGLELAFWPPAIVIAGWLMLRDGIHAFNLTLVAIAMAGALMSTLLAPFELLSSVRAWRPRRTERPPIALALVGNALVVAQVLLIIALAYVTR